jgi:hypothetical protein
MKTRPIPGSLAFLSALGLTAAILFGSACHGDPGQDAPAKTPAAAPARQVIACYFHRTVRCPTCRTISAYAEESLQAGFKKEMKQSRVVWKMVDFQDAKNQKLVEAYQIQGPTLVLMDVRKGKVVDWKPVPKVWSLVPDKEAFVKYVQKEVRTLLEKK